MTQFDPIPEARGLGIEGSEFRLFIDHLAEYMHTFNLALAKIEAPTMLVVTFRDRRLALVFTPYQDGRLGVEVRMFRDDELIGHQTHAVGMVTLLDG